MRMERRYVPGTIYRVRLLCNGYNTPYTTYTESVCILERRPTMKTHDYNKYAKNYAELGITNSYYMAFKDIPLLLEKYSQKNMKFLDYGCGTGRSLRFIRSFGYNDIVGVDISNDMLSQAKKIDPLGDYCLIENSRIPYDDNTFDIIFMSYVFLEIGEYDKIVEVLKEFKRVLKSNGYVIFITSIVKNIKDKWLSFSYDFPENNKDLSQCQNLKLLIKYKNETSRSIK